MFVAPKNILIFSLSGLYVNSTILVRHRKSLGVYFRFDLYGSKPRVNRQGDLDPILHPNALETGFKCSYSSNFVKLISRTLISQMTREVHPDRLKKYNWPEYGFSFI